MHRELVSGIQDEIGELDRGQSIDEVNFMVFFCALICLLFDSLCLKIILTWFCTGCLGVGEAKSTHVLFNLQ